MLSLVDFNRPADKQHEFQKLPENELPSTTEEMNRSPDDRIQITNEKASDRLSELFRGMRCRRHRKVQPKMRVDRLLFLQLPSIGRLDFAKSSNVDKFDELAKCDEYFDEQ